jgi:preprotein translocase subunit SecA
MKIFGGENLKNWINSINTDPNEPLVSDFLTTSLENAQKKVENYNYEIRKNIFLYDTIINYLRKEFFKGRNEMLYSIGNGTSFKNIFENYFLPSSEEFLIKEFLKKEIEKKKLKIKIEKNFHQYFFYSKKN